MTRDLAYGSKDDYRLLGDALTSRGIVAVIPDYRHYPETTFPGWVEDGAAAVLWTVRNARGLGGDGTQIWVVGHSSGAHSAALLDLDEHYLRDVGVAVTAVRGYVSLAGPVTTEWADADVQAAMGPRERWAATYPSTHVDGTEQPLLLIHGSADDIVSPENSPRLAALIRSRGGCARTIEYKGVGHVELVLALAIPRLALAPALDDVVKFIHDSRFGCPSSWASSPTR